MPPFKFPKVYNVDKLNLDKHFGYQNSYDFGK